MSKGTIIYIGGFEMPDRNAAAHRVLNNAKILRRIGYNVVFCGVDKTISEDCVVPQRLGPFWNMPSKYPQKTSEWVKSLVDFSHIKNTFSCFDDVKYVFAYNMHARPLSNLLKYCHKRKIKVFADATEWYGNAFSLHPIKFVRWYDTHHVMTNLQKKADGIIAISTFLEEYYRPFVKNIIRVPPLVDIEEEMWKAEPENYPETVEFTYTGVAGRDKDKLGLIVKCFSNIQQDFLFTIYGLTQEQFLCAYPDLESEIRMLEGKIVFKGRVSHTESVLGLKRADYCVFIRDRNRKNMAGFPTKLAECVTSGTGIIANNVSNIEDYFPLMNSYLLDSINIDEIVAYIRLAIKNGKVMHTQNRKFHWENEVDKFDSFLKNVDVDSENLLL